MFSHFKARLCPLESLIRQALPAIMTKNDKCMQLMHATEQKSGVQCIVVAVLLLHAPKKCLSQQGEQLQDSPWA